MACPAMSAAVRATSGAAILQGPHHAAQKSASTGTFAFCNTSSNCSRSTSSGSLIGGSVDLQLPHLPLSARCFAGILFFCPHCLQLRMNAIWHSWFQSTTWDGIAFKHSSVAQSFFIYLKRLQLAMVRRKNMSSTSVQTLFEAFFVA
jgi:hypothetical protein